MEAALPAMRVDGFAKIGAVRAKRRREATKSNWQTVKRYDRLSRPRSAAKIPRKPRRDAPPKWAKRLAQVARNLALLAQRRPEPPPLALPRIPPWAARSHCRRQSLPQHWLRTLNSTWRLRAAVLGPRMQQYC